VQEAPVSPVSNPPATLGAKILNAAEQVRNFLVVEIVRPVEAFVKSAQECVQGAAEVVSSLLARIRKTIVARGAGSRSSASVLKRKDACVPRVCGGQLPGCLFDGC